MRISGGNLRGRRIPDFNWGGTKPSTEKTRLGLMNFLMHNISIKDSKMLDLFAGTGLVGLEFLSRGGKELFSLDKNAKAVNYMLEIKNFFKLDYWTIKCFDIEIENFDLMDSYEIIFADPPYEYAQMDELIAKIILSNLLAEDGLFILEHRSSRIFNLHLPYKSSKYGESTISFFKK